MKITSIGKNTPFGVGNDPDAGKINPLEEAMKKIANLIALVVFVCFSFPVFAQTKPAPKVKKCGSADLPCRVESGEALDDVQDLSIRALESRSDANEAVDAELSGRFYELAYRPAPAAQTTSRQGPDFESVLADYGLADDIDQAKKEAKCETRRLDGSLNPACTACSHPPCAAGSHPLVGAVGIALEDNASQDRELAKAKSDLAALRKAQRSFARAKDLKSATDRIAVLEEARAALPADLVGRGDIEAMIIRAETASKSQLDAAVEVLQKGLGDRMNKLETDVAELNGRVSRVEGRVYKTENRLDSVDTHLYYSSTRLDFGVWVANHGIGTEGGGAIWILFPLGTFSALTARIGGGVGGADKDNTVGWLVQFDLLARWDWFSVGPSGLILGASDSKGNRDLVPAGGISFRADMVEDWLFAQATPFFGAGLEDPDKTSAVGGILVEAGLHF